MAPRPGLEPGTNRLTAAKTKIYFNTNQSLTVFPQSLSASKQQ